MVIRIWYKVNSRKPSAAREPHLVRGGGGDSGRWSSVVLPVLRGGFVQMLLSRPSLLGFPLTGCGRPDPRTSALAVHFAWNTLLDNHIVPSSMPFRSLQKYHLLIEASLSKIASVTSTFPDSLLCCFLKGHTTT